MSAKTKVNLTAFCSLVMIIGLQCSLKSVVSREEGQYSIRIITLDEWGGSPVEEGSHFTHNPTMLTLHHGGVDWKDGQDPKEYLRNLQTWSRREKKWIDIPYHYMIDLEGNIYAARDYRYPGDTNTTYSPQGHLLTCVMGNYENRIPTVEQIEAVINLIAWQCDHFKIDPESLKGHKDYAQTACPGKHLYPYISSGFFVREIKKRIGKVRLVK